MKKTVLLIGLVASVLIACNNNPEATNQNEVTTTKQDTLNKTAPASADSVTGKKEQEEEKEKDKDD